MAKATSPGEIEIKVVSVVDPFIHSLEEIGLFGSKRTERAHRAINSAIEILKKASVKISGAVLAGRPAYRIIQEAKAWNADLIVVGTHERRGLQRLLLGSISEAIANGAHCSVKIVRNGSESPANKPADLGRPSDLRTMTAYKLAKSD